VENELQKKVNKLEDQIELSKEQIEDMKTELKIDKEIQVEIAEKGSSKLMKS